MACDSFEVHSVHSKPCPHIRIPSVLFIQTGPFFGSPQLGTGKQFIWRALLKWRWSCLGLSDRLALSGVDGCVFIYIEPYFETCQATGKSLWAAFEESLLWWMGEHISSFYFHPCLEAYCVIIPKLLVFCLDSPCCKMAVFQGEVY